MTDYCYPTSVEEALAYLIEYRGEARIVAGGTDVLPDVRDGRIAPRCLVDITRIPALRSIEVGEDVVTVGAAVTFSSIRRDAFLRGHVHALVEAASSVGAEPIQNAATWVGNIVQAMPAADGAIIAVALDAQARVVDREGARWQGVEMLFEGPGLSAVDPRWEIVTHLRFPRPRSGTGTAWRRVGRRSALVLPILNCAVRVELVSGPGSRPGGEMGDERIGEVAIAMGPVAPRPARAQGAEAFLIGRVAQREVLERAAEIARGDANPRTSVMRASREYRLEIIPRLIEDALIAAVDRAHGGG